jgi:hypothetical protein
LFSSCRLKTVAELIKPTEKTLFNGGYDE